MRHEIRPTAAILCAEEVTERWCCPLCGGLNRTDGDGSSKGWCQHQKCIDRRYVSFCNGAKTRPEILFHAHFFEARETIFA